MIRNLKDKVLKGQIQTGIELANQMFVALGLSSAATLARLTSRESEALRWERESQQFMQAMLRHKQFSLVDRRGFIKRRDIDGSVQETIKPEAEARLAEGVPLASGGKHYLNPDTSAALPIAIGIIPPDSSVASRTLEQLESFWNQAWEGGGYGWYHMSSEADSLGPWPFPSLFIARAYTETENFNKVWRILRWLGSLPGSTAGSWFEFYGHRFAPPYPQVGIPPWTWAEMLILLIHHIIGIQPDVNFIRIRPKLLTGLEKTQTSLRVRDQQIELEIKKDPGIDTYQFQTDGTILKSLDREVHVMYPKDKLHVEVNVP